MKKETEEMEEKKKGYPGFASNVHTRSTDPVHLLIHRYQNQFQSQKKKTETETERVAKESFPFEIAKRKTMQ